MTKFQVIIDALSFVAVFYGGYWAALKAVKEYFQTRVSEADKKSQAGMITMILKEIEMLKECQQKGTYNDREMRILIDRLIDDLKFLMQQLFENSLPKRNTNSEIKD